MKKLTRRPTGRNAAEMESEVLQSCRHVCRGAADPNADIYVPTRTDPLLAIVPPIFFIGVVARGGLSTYARGG